MKKLELFILLVVVIGLCGCSTTYLHDVSERFDVQKIRTYRIEDPDSSLFIDSSGFLSDRIRKALLQSLTDRGWRLSEQKPDVIVTWDSILKAGLRNPATESKEEAVENVGFFRVGRRRRRRFYRRSIPFYPGWWFGPPYMVDPPPPPQRSALGIRILDGVNRELLWRGWAVFNESDEPLTQERIATLVRNILERLPN